VHLLKDKHVKFPETYTSSYGLVIRDSSKNEYLVPEGLIYFKDYVLEKLNNEPGIDIPIEII
jgi:hypothetical protein